MTDFDPEPDTDSDSNHELETPPQFSYSKRLWVILFWSVLIILGLLFLKMTIQGRRARDSKAARYYFDIGNIKALDRLIEQSPRPRRILVELFHDELLRSFTTNSDDETTDFPVAYQYLAQKTMETNALTNWSPYAKPPIYAVLEARVLDNRRNFLRGKFGKHLLDPRWHRSNDKVKDHVNNIAVQSPSPLAIALERHDLVSAEHLLKLGFKLDKTTSIEVSLFRQPPVTHFKSPYPIYYSILKPQRGSTRYSNPPNLLQILKWLKGKGINWNNTRTVDLSPILKSRFPNATHIKRPFGNELIESAPKSQLLAILVLLKSVNYDFTQQDTLLDESGNLTSTKTMADILDKRQAFKALKWLTDNTSVTLTDNDE